MYLLVLSFLFAATSFTHGQEQTLSLALKSLQNEGQLKKNPLQDYNFESYISRCYLYVYRAQAYARMAGQGQQKLQNFERALSDLQKARLSPHCDNQRLEQVSVDILKGRIDAYRALKNYERVIEAIEVLPPRERNDNKYIIFYAQALFESKNLEDFKKLAKNYITKLKDKNILKSYLSSIPAWDSELALIEEPLIASKEPAKIVAELSKEALLKDPRKHLAALKKDTYFKSSEALFKLASELYFTHEKANSERKFVRSFRRTMHYFAPSYMDSLIFSFWKKGDLKTAEMLSMSFLRHFEGHPLYPKVLFNLARLQEDSKNYSKAIRNYEKFLELSDALIYLELTHFRLPWLLYLAKREQEAKSYFEQYISKYPDGRYASTTEYFLLKLAEKEDSHQELVKNFIAKYPFNLFSFLLVDEHGLDKNIILQTLSLEKNDQEKITIPSFKADIKTLAQLKLLRELKSFGLIEDAKKVLANISLEPDNELLALYVASEFQDLNHTHGELNALLKVVAKPNAYRDLVVWQRLFPRYRLDMIASELTTQNLDISPLLVLSLIRQESAFNGAARSVANAQGLMQLTEGTAKDSAKKLQMPKFSLLSEEDNIRLGIKTFSDLLKKYQRLDYALSAYNAGESVTNLWINLRGHLEPIMFIESIPYPETRVYIKSILRNIAIYRMLYEEAPSPLVSYRGSL